MSKITWKATPSMIAWNKLSTLRRERGLTQLQVAASSGVSIATLWFIEQGFDKKTSLKTKQKLAIFFKCDVDDLFPVEMIGNITLEQHLKESQTQKA